MRYEFLKPRLDGPRFNDHGIPLELLKDFAALEEMIVEVAKWKFRQANPGRERIPRSFTKGLDLLLTGVEEGSAIPVIFLRGGLLVPDSNARYFEQARDDIIESIACAEQGTTPLLPASLLGIFDRFGRGLREGESIEFPAGQERNVRMTPEIRRRLIRSSQVDVWTEETSLRGMIPELDQARMSFELELRDGTRLKAPLTSQHFETVMEAFNSYRLGVRVNIQGVVKKDKQDCLKTIESVAHVRVLDPLDVTARLDELAELRDGWLDGKGRAPAPVGLRWLSGEFESRFDPRLPLPYLYPTPAGGIQAEWSLKGWEISLLIDIQSQTCDYQALRWCDDQLEETRLDLTEPEGWEWLNQAINAIEKASA